MWIQVMQVIFAVFTFLAVQAKGDENSPYCTENGKLVDWNVYYDDVRRLIGGRIEYKQYDCYNYKSFPEIFRPYTVSLNMESKNNTFERLTNGMFDKTVFSDLTDLHLENCQIKVIEISAFSGLANLSLLNLQDNLIQYLDLKVFSNLHYLEHLKLNANPIKQFINDHAFPIMPAIFELLLGNCKLYNINLRVFRNLKGRCILNLSNNPLKGFSNEEEFPPSNITDLNLNNCSIHSVHANLFKNLEKLFWLGLTDNMLVTLDWKGFVPLKYLKKVELRNNPLQCDYQIKILLDFFVTRKVIWNGSSPIRYSSRGHISQDYSALEWNQRKDQLVCSAKVNSIKHISCGPVAAESENSEWISLECEYNGYPQPKVSWTANGKPVDLNSSATTSVFLGTLEEHRFSDKFKQILSIPLISVHNETVFKCQVENSGGTESKVISVKWSKKLSALRNENEENSSKVNIISVIVGIFSTIVFILSVITVGAICVVVLLYRNRSNRVTKEFYKALPEKPLAVALPNFDEQPPSSFVREENQSYDYAYAGNETQNENTYETPISP